MSERVSSGPFSPVVGRGGAEPPPFQSSTPTIDCFEADPPSRACEATAAGSSVSMSHETCFAVFSYANFCSKQEATSGKVHRY